jgi:hypothetical protein
MKPDSMHTFEVTTNPAVTCGSDGKYYMMYISEAERWKYDFLDGGK